MTIKLSELYNLIEQRFQEGQYTLSHLEAWWLGISSDLDVENVEQRELRTNIQYSSLEELENKVLDPLLNSRDNLKVLLACEYKNLLAKIGKPVVPTEISEAWCEGRLFSMLEKFKDLDIDDEHPDDAPDNSLYIYSKYQKLITKEHRDRGIKLFLRHQFVEPCLVSMSSEEWGKFFQSLATKWDEKDEKVFCLPSLGYQVWMKWEAEDFQFINPEYSPRLFYYAEGVELKGTLMTSEDVWGNTLLFLMRSGLTRNSFGSLLRLRATNFVVPTQVYGNKSTYNKEVEISKPGILKFAPSFAPNSKGINITVSNSDNKYAVAEAYTLMNSEGIVSFPQHQGEDLRADMAAWGAGINLIEYNGIKIYLFERTVDKITKVFNRCALLNRVGTHGECIFDPADM